MFLTAGQREHIRGLGPAWLFLDIGFAGTRGKTCGIAFGENVPKCVTFAEACREIVKYVENSECNPLNLVIEAPLSVSFDCNGNPKARSIEKDGTKTRCWYTGPGAAVMVAAMYLARILMDHPSDKHLRLFEGFISFKTRGKKSNHTRDVELLREVVQRPADFPGSIIAPENLKQHPDDTLQSALAVMGHEAGCISVIIRRDF